MGKSTPGPWTWEPHYHGLRAREGKEILTFEPYEGMYLSYQRTDAERDANAWVIAAAPDLLDALKTLLAASERHIFSTECQRERDAARAAIAKAEGQK